LASLDTVFKKDAVPGRLFFVFQTGAVSPNIWSIKKFKNLLTFTLGGTFILNA